MKSFLMSSIIAVIVAGFLCAPSQCSASTDLQQTVKACEEWYPLGEQVTFVYTLKNTGSQTLVYKFRSGKQFDAWVTFGGTEVYRAGRNTFYTQALTNLTLRAGESKEFRIMWDQKDLRGGGVGTGWYTVHAQLESMVEKPYEVSSRVWVGEMTPVVVVPLTVLIGEAKRRAQELTGKTIVMTGNLKEETIPDLGRRFSGGSKAPMTKLVFSDSSGSIQVTGIDISQVGKDGKATLTGKLSQSNGQVYFNADTPSVSPAASPINKDRGVVLSGSGVRRRPR